MPAPELEGCGYWGDIYKQLFENNFELDQVALERRLAVPTEVQERGAAVVASYLQEFEKGGTRLNEASIIILGEKGAGMEVRGSAERWAGCGGLG